MPFAARIVWLSLIAVPVIFPQAPAGERSSASKKPGVAAAVDRKVAPLSELPYSPSLDVNSMDRSADPCTNFYQYACGGWIKKNPIPADQARWDVYSKLQYENEQFLWGILEEAGKPSANRSAAQQKIGDYFYACMDESAV
jgi:putative endopeptidase